jgi:hypothetical protein
MNNIVLSILNKLNHEEIISFYKKVYCENDIVMSELLRNMKLKYLTPEDISYLLEWAGDSEYVTAEQLINEVKELDESA